MQKSAESAVKAIFGRDSALRRASPRHTARSWHAEEFDKLEKSETKTWTWSTSNYKHTYSGNVVARAGVLYDFQFSLGTSFGLHLHEVPSTLWELVPGSFVWDWWFNTGKYIRAITPKIGVRTLASWVRVTATYDYAYELSSSARTVANWSISDNRKAGFEEQRVHTRRYPGVRPAHVMYKLPSKQTEADKARTVDAISLILQQLKGK